ncbi:MAG TPA: hypothetical protein VI356_11905 [Myxococcales bacterium]
MTMLKMFVLPFSLATLLLAARPASASTVDECQALIAVLSDQTAAATYLRGDLGLKLEAQLLQHLSKTSNELTLSDPKEALRQMGDFSFTLARGVDAAKIDATDAAALQVGADGVVSCIQQIQ